MENVLCYHNGAQCQLVHRNFHRDSMGMEREKSIEIICAIEISCAFTAAVRGTCANYTACV